ncbi:(d)CMP kinase [Actinomycetota bacterium]
MSAPLVVAVDGPSGSGKSSVSKAVATQLGVGYLDTGAMYRALTVHCLHREVPLGDAEAITAAAEDFPLMIGTDPDAVDVLVGGRNVTEEIRSSEVSSVVSKVATVPAVRELMRRLQREMMDDIAETTGGVVAEGRDITTVVYPDATVRLLVTASEEARLARRSKELHGHAEADAVEATRDQIVRRDAEDSTVSQFTTAADGVITIDTSDLDFDQSVQAVLAAIRSVRPEV